MRILVVDDSDQKRAHVLQVLRDELGSEYDLTLVIDGAPKVLLLTVDPDENLVQMPAPMSELAHLLHPPPADVGGEHRSEPVPPEPHRLVTNTDPPLEQQIFNAAQRERVADVHQHDQADHLRRRVEVAEGSVERAITPS